MDYSLIIFALILLSGIWGKSIYIDQPNDYDIIEPKVVRSSDLTLHWRNRLHEETTLIVERTFFNPADSLLHNITQKFHILNGENNEMLPHVESVVTKVSALISLLVYYN